MATALNIRSATAVIGSQGVIKIYSLTSQK